jgi:hypothetical protein
MEGILGILEEEAVVYINHEAVVVHGKARLSPPACATSLVIAIVVLEFKLKGAYSLHFQELAPARRASAERPTSQTCHYPCSAATLLPRCYIDFFSVLNARCEDSDS